MVKVLEADERFHIQHYVPVRSRKNTQTRSMLNEKMESEMRCVPSLTRGVRYYVISCSSRTISNVQYERKVIISFLMAEIVFIKRGVRIKVVFTICKGTKKR